MSVKVNHYLNGSLVNLPNNAPELSVELNFDRDRTTTQPQVSLTTAEWVANERRIINQHIDNGTNGGVGIFEGIPYKIEIDRAGVLENLFDGYVDTADAANVFGRIKSTTTVKEDKSIDWLNDVADGFSFEYLFEEIGLITSNDFVAVPYVLNSVPSYREAAISTLTLYFVQIELRNAIKELSKLAASLANPFEWTAIVKMVIESLYLISLIIALVQMIKDIILFIIQPVKYHSAMSLKKHFEKGCSHLGLTFKSDIFDNTRYKDAYLIPKKRAQLDNPQEPRIFNFTTFDPVQQFGFYKGTFGQFLRDMKIMFNAKIQLIFNPQSVATELHFLRDDEMTGQPQYQLPDNLDRYEIPEWSYNTEDFKANYNVSFATDVTDKNTIQNYGGVAYSAQLRPQAIQNSNLVLMKGLEEVRIPFARARRKTALTVPEQIANIFVQIFNALVSALISAANVVIQGVNAILGAINTMVNALQIIGINLNVNIQPIPQINNPNLGNLITNRIGMMMIENDSFEVDKIAIIDVASQNKNTKISTDDETYISAQHIYNLFHFIKSWLPSTTKPTGNQYRVKQFKNFPFTFSNYLQVKGNNYILDKLGNIAEIVTLRWNPYKQTADFTIRFPFLITNNLRLIEIIPNGE